MPVAKKQRFNRMAPISEVDLIINSDGSVYHLGIKPEDLADIVLVVGDPDRVASVSKYFDTVTFAHQKREFTTHTGLLNGTRITVLSTGMGTDNIEIVMHELDALANIDFKSRLPKSTLKSLQIIRIGTSGAIQKDINLGNFLVSSNAFGYDTHPSFYSFKHTESVSCQSLAVALKTEALPYFAHASSALLELFKQNPAFTFGTTLTMSGFYGPQGRSLRFAPKNYELLKAMELFRFKNNDKISNLEMETAGYYFFGELLGHQCLSISAILANRIINRFSENPDYVVDTLIKEVLEAVIVNRSV
jgi:uridine phosphorylase